MQLEVIKAQSPWEQTKGLLGVKKAYPLLLTTRFGIHTFGMQFPIDVVILNQRGTVMKIKENLKPNRLFFWNPKYTSVLELPQGEINKRGLKCGIHVDVRSQ